MIRKKEKSKPKDVELASIKAENIYTNPKSTFNSQIGLLDAPSKPNAKDGDYDSVATIPLTAQSSELENVEIFDEIGSGNFGCNDYIN